VRGDKLDMGNLKTSKRLTESRKKTITERDTTMKELKAAMKLVTDKNLEV
jgi:hypothetical protein